MEGKDTLWKGDIDTLVTNEVTMQGRIVVIANLQFLARLLDAKRFF